MEKPQKPQTDSSILRSKAEELYSQKKRTSDSRFSDADFPRLVHELEVHQIELDLQNDELTKAIEQTGIALQKYSDLYDFAPIGYFTLSAKGAIMEINLIGSQMLGKNRADLINYSFGLFVSGESKPIFSDFLNTIFINKKKETCELNLLTPGDLLSEVYLSGKCTGNGDQCLVVMIDITERKKSDGLLKISNERNRSVILQTAMDGFWLIDKKGQLLEVNDTYCRMTGYSEQELLKMNVSDLEVVESLAETKVHIEKTILSGEDRFESRHRRKDGSIFAVEISVQYQAVNGGRFVAFLRDITENKLANEKLRQSEDRYKTLFQGNNSIMLLIDPLSGEIKDANPSACLFYGYSHSEICSKKVSEINTLSDQEVTEELRLAISEKRNHFFFKHRLANNEIRDVEIYTGPINFGDSNLLYSIVHDITERKRAENALKERELIFRKYIDFAPHGIFVSNEKGEYVDVNSAAALMTGYTADELLTMKITDLVAEDSLEYGKAHFSKVIKEGYSNGELSFIRKDKSLGYWSVDAVKLSGNLYLGFVVDLTSRRQAEELLIESEQRYRSLFEESNDAIFLVDLSTGNYLDCNRLAVTLTGYSHDEIMQMKTGSMLPPPLKEEVQTNLEVIMSGRVLRRETEIFSKEGKIIPVEFTSSLVTINKRQCILSLLHDISDRKAAEEALKLSEARVRTKLQSILSPEGSIADLELEDILDIDTIQKLMDSFNSLVEIPMAIVDLNGRVLVKTGWQDICSKFHRIHPETCWNCIESDVHLSHGIPEGEFRLYKCKNNMWDIATPLIIGGEHKGNLFLGQFFLENEPIDHNYFREQAIRVGFPTQEYMEALDQVPRLNKQKLDHAKAFFLNLSHSITQLSYSNVKLAKAITQQKQVEAALRESEEFLKKAQQIGHLGSWSHELATNHLSWSDEMYSIFCIQPAEFKGTFGEFLDSVHPDDRAAVNTAYTNSITGSKNSFETEHRIVCRNSGEIRHVFEKCEHSRDASGNIIRSVGLTLDITDRKLSEEALSENERLLRESQAVAHIGSYATNMKNKTWKASPEIYEIFGIDEKYPHTLDGWVGRIHPDFREELVNELFLIQKDRKVFEHEYKIIRFNDGAERWIHGLGEFEYDDTPHPFRLIGTIQDITERKAKEKALYKLNRALAALSKSSLAMSHSVNEEDYLQKVCKIVVEDTDFAMVWIGFAEDDEAKTVRPVASAGFTNNYIETLKVSWDDSEFGHGPTGTAIRTGKMCKCNNMLTDPSFEPWREQAIRQGFASSAVFPLKSGDKTFGAISIYSNEPDTFLEDEISMLGELANDLANGITTFRLQATQQLAEEALSRSHNQLEGLVKERTSELLVTNELLKKEIKIRKQKEQSLKSAEEKYRTVADYTSGWEYWIGPDEDIKYMSPSVEKITGYVEEEFKQNPQLLNQIIYPDDLPLWRNHNLESLKPDQNYSHEDIGFRIITKSGEVRWIGHVCRRIYMDGKYIGIRVSNRDITEKVKAENELLNVTVKVEEHERSRISRELHDGLGPLLSTIKLYFQWLAETDNPSKIKIITEKGNQSIDRAIQTTREVSHGLNSHVLTTYGYVGAILQFIQSINETQKLNIDFNPNSNERFSDLLEITLYRITTELINNTLNYASASNVEIDFDYHKDKKVITFTYTDDGIGFDMEQIEKAKKGLGLINIQQRLKIVKGTISIESSLGNGIRVHIELPVNDTID